MASEDMEPPSKAPRRTDNNNSDTEESSCIFASPWHFSDVVLVVEGRKFHAHKSTLSMLESPVFEKMFSSGFREKKSKEISLPGKNADEFEVLLKTIYSFKTDQKVTFENLEFLLKLADEYQIERVKDLCVDHLYDLFHLYDGFELCRIANQYALGDIITDSIRKASKMNMKSIESSPCYSDFSDGLKLQILTERIKHLEILLKQYFLTCSSLVDKAYAAISKKVTNYECDRHELHDVEKVGGITQRKYFDSKCIRCIERLERKWPEKDTLTKYLKDPLKKLMSYNMLDYEDLNL